MDSSRVKLAALLPVAALLLASCEHATMTNPVTNPAQFTQNISAADLDSTLVKGTARVVVRLARNDSLVARRIIVKLRSGLTRPEEVEGRVSAVASGSTADTMTFGDLGGLQVVINDSTHFRGDLDEGGNDSAEHRDSMETHDVIGMSDGPGGLDEDGGRALLTRADFTAQIKLLLAAGRRPNVRAMRPAPSSPQAPGNASFVATSVRLDEGDEAAEIEMNVDSANFTSNATPPPLGWITVLGLKIEIRSSTRISADLDDTEGEGRFGGIVKAVDTTAHSFTLSDSTVVRVVAGTEFEDGEDGMGLATLAEVQAALAAGKTVSAHGRGILDSAGPPRTFIAIEVRFFAGISLGSMAGM